MIRKLLIALLSITCVAGGAAGVAACSPERNSGTGGNGSGSPTHFVKPDSVRDSHLEYELNEDGDGYIVKGVGLETNTVITIPDEYKDETLNEEALPVTAIAETAFSKEATSEVTRKITNISIGRNVEEIGDGAFAGCIALKSISIPDSVSKLGTGVFANCTGLLIVNIGSSLRRIENSMFMNCTSLKTISIPSNITQIGDNAFEGCTGLTSLRMGQNVVQIGKRSFAKCTGLTNLNLATRYLRTIGERAFYDCGGLRSVVIGGAAISEIGFAAFSQCNNLQSITLPFVGYKRYTSLANFNAESNNGANSVYEEFTDEETGSSATYCTSNFGFIFGATQTEDNNTQQYRGRYIPLSLNTVKIQGGFVIPPEAFMYCYNLSSIEISGNVERLGNECFAYCEIDALILSTSVTSIGEDVCGLGSLAGLYYEGNSSEWNSKVKISTSGLRNETLNSADKYYYLSSAPATPGNYWHRDPNGAPIPW